MDIFVRTRLQTCDTYHGPWYMTEFPHPINPGQPEGTGVKSAGLIGRQYFLFCYAFRSGVVIRMLKMYTMKLTVCTSLKPLCTDIFVPNLFSPFCY